MDGKIKSRPNTQQKNVYSHRRLSMANILLISAVSSSLKRKLVLIWSVMMLFLPLPSFYSLIPVNIYFLQVVPQYKKLAFRHPILHDRKNRAVFSLKKDHLIVFQAFIDIGPC